MIIHLQHSNVALAHCYLIFSYLSHSILGGEFDHQVVSGRYSLSQVKGKLTQDGVVSEQTINNQKLDIFGDLLRVITNRHEQSDHTEGVYSCSSKSNEQSVGWNQLFSFNPHLLECWVVEDISRALIVYKDPVGVVVPYPYANYEHIVVWVVETSSIFLCESNYRVVNSCHLWD